MLAAGTDSVEQVWRMGHWDGLVVAGHEVVDVGVPLGCGGRVFRRQDENCQVTRPTDWKDPSMSHRNAPLSVEGRRRLVARCERRPIAHVTAEMGISRQCASKWVNRYRQFGELGLADRSSAPRHQPTATPAAVVVARIEWMRACTSGRRTGSRSNSTPRTPRSAAAPSPATYTTWG